MIKKFLLVCAILISSLAIQAQTKLTHNTCGPIIKTTDHSCSNTFIYWARDFRLDEFGITGDEELIIETGEVGLSYATWGASVQFNIYKIDDNFPASFSESDLIGSSQAVQVWMPYSEPPEKIQIDFENPVVIPPDVDRILVEVKKGMLPNSDGLAHIAGTAEDTGVSWYRGCLAGEAYVNAEETQESYNYPVADYNFFINAIGRKRSDTNPFYIAAENLCTDAFTNFSISNASEVKNIEWNFGEPASGSYNTSSILAPSHEFTNDGIYNISAKVTSKSGQVYQTSKEIKVTKAPETFQVDDAYLCETEEGFAEAGSFIIDKLAEEIAGDQENIQIQYVHEDGKIMEYPMPAYSRDYVSQLEEITVRINYVDEPCCYNEKVIKIFLQEAPAYEVEDLVVCEENSSGFAQFDLNIIKEQLKAEYDDLSIDFFNSENVEISNNDISNYQNSTAERETITAVVREGDGCEVFETFDLIARPSPPTIELEDIIGCDDNNDGVSEYFDTSGIASSLNQTQTSLSYYDSEGNKLDDLPNPYTNLKKYQDFIRIRITDDLSGCYSEIRQNLITSTKPRVNNPGAIIACNEGNGFAHFDTSGIVETIIGNQSNLHINFYDIEGNELTDFGSSSFVNSIPFQQQITARVENRNNKSCATELSFSLVTNELPEIALENSYEICSMGASLELKVNSGYSAYTWFGPQGNILSEEASLSINAEGTYGLSVLEEKNGILCENYKEFQLLHSQAPVIEDVVFTNFSENSSIEILASGDGMFEYSIDGSNFQISNIFEQVSGGTYTVMVRDRYGCGEASQTINLINYPRFFTPNNDGYNDRWNIKGLSNSETAFISIYDRYGKLLKQFAPNNESWDGDYNGRKMPSDDYWFQLNLDDGSTYSGHFSLLR